MARDYTEKNSQKRILLINPPEATEENYKPKPLMPPIGLLKLATFLKNNGIETKILDLAASGKPFALLRNSLRKEKQKIVGISIVSPLAIFPSQKITAIAREYCGNAKIIAGGCCVSAMGADAFEILPELDFVVAGFGELSSLKLIKTIQKKERIQKIKGVFSKAQTVKGNWFEKSLKPEQIPIPELTFINLSAYQKRKAIYPIESSRGCHFSCSFCTSVMPGYGGNIVFLNNPHLKVWDFS